MNPTVDNDLQKAIDDITKNTNTDPVFSDPVAAPSSVPEGDRGVIAEPVGPFADIKSPVMPAPAPMPPLPKAPAPNPVATAPVAPASAPVAPAPMPEPVMPPMPEPVVTETTVTAEEETLSTPNAADMHSVKEAALRDLAPLLGKIDMDSSKKFKLYKDIREELHDNSVIGDAYAAAKDIADDNERGEALLYLVESIDNL